MRLKLYRRLKHNLSRFDSLGMNRKFHNVFNPRFVRPEALENRTLSCSTDRLLLTFSRPTKTFAAFTMAGSFEFEFTRHSWLLLWRQRRYSYSAI